MALSDDMLAQEALAVVGVSRHARGYGYKVWRDLQARGIRVYAVNPKAEEIEGERAYAKVADLPEPVGGVFTVVPPERMMDVVRDCIAAGVPRIWMQPGSESEESIALARESGIEVSAHACILML